ncbi:hypothetical protein ACTJK4_17350 [Ralstonia sp. 22111]|uniref:hypothetical protein n=1 Tax=Ralstonia sp. 22111 TaxID=3453878 RepID=UPI003F868CBC
MLHIEGVPHGIASPVYIVLVIMSVLSAAVGFGVFRKLQPRDTIQMHIAARQWLANELMVPTQRKRVVVTHHAPSKQSVSMQYQGDLLTPAYASHLDDVVELVDLWIHGHMHDSFDYTVGACRVVCNPRGYAPKGRVVENAAFNPGLTIQSQVIGTPS